MSRPIDEPGAIILLEVDASEPLSIVAGFLPVLQPMWPAGLGGQYASWDDALKAYVISESTRKNHGLVGSPAGEGALLYPGPYALGRPQPVQDRDRQARGRQREVHPRRHGRREGEPGHGDRSLPEAGRRPRAVYRGAEEHYARPPRFDPARRDAGSRPRPGFRMGEDRIRQPRRRTIPTSGAGSSPASDRRARAGGRASAGSSEGTPSSTS